RRRALQVVAQRHRRVARGGQRRGTDTAADRLMARFGKRRPRPAPVEPPVPPSALSPEQERQEFHAHSEPIPTRPIRTVFIDVATDQQLGFWDAPLWLPVGGVIEGGDDLWEIVSVRL